MDRGFSLNREFDFVREGGLTRATGRRPHDWDLYILKELIDNALDADDLLWRDDPEKFPVIAVQLEVDIETSGSRQLYVRVSNRAPFPVDELRNIFDTRRYSSRKAFIRGLTRGSLGNALKTILGIVYCLRERVASDWQPELKPLAIKAGGREYRPRFVADSTAQEIQLSVEESEINPAAGAGAGKAPVHGTVIAVGLDDFRQENPRCLEELMALAHQYRLANPHAAFSWHIELGDEDWQAQWAQRLGWSGKYLGPPSIEWYTPSSFQDLLGALLRRRPGDPKKASLPLAAIGKALAGYRGEDGPAARKALDRVREAASAGDLSAGDVEGARAQTLFAALSRHTPPFPAQDLGALGREHVEEALGEMLDLAGPLHYRREEMDGGQDSVPFVLEAALARLESGQRRLWTAVNFTPSYGDPFQKSRLAAADGSERPVVGLAGLFGSAGFDEASSTVLFVHLICPSLEYGDFSKTEINHLPFKNALARLARRLVGDLEIAEREAESRLRSAVMELLGRILGGLEGGERLVPRQLLARLRRELERDSDHQEFLASPLAEERLNAYLVDFHAENAHERRHLVGSAPGTVLLPVHPNRYFAVEVGYLSDPLLASHHVDKLLLLGTEELEPVVIENGWLCRLDLGVLRLSGDEDRAQGALVQAAEGCSVPLLALHDAGAHGPVAMWRDWLRQRGLDDSRLLDLGLTAPGADSPGGRLMELLPGEQLAWLEGRLAGYGISLKHLPEGSAIRQQLAKAFEDKLLARLWEAYSVHLQLPALLDRLDRRLKLASRMSHAGLDLQVSDRLLGSHRRESYETVRQAVVEEFFQEVLEAESEEIHRLAREHMNAWREGL